ncbi:MAG: hypothetical protein B7Y42_00360 [Polaromonas sp. 28-63-22]|jgi:hypothetical protein|nr:MAG: hypothetical protein B7Y42_00360 [Polaromonas sp. 28-63-22]
MNNERIQRWLADQAQLGSATAAELEAGEIIVFFAGPDGAIGIADEAAWELVCSECLAEEKDGHIWYRTHPLEMELALDDEDDRISALISSALRYLSRRQLLVCHPDSASLVRPKTDSLLDQACGLETASEG